MNVLLRCSVIVAACNEGIKTLEDKWADIDALDAQAKRGFWGFIYRLGGSWPAPRPFKDHWSRMMCLRAIAKHKMSDGVFTVADPYLSDIALYLPPYVSERV